MRHVLLLIERGGHRDFSRKLGLLRSRYCTRAINAWSTNVWLPILMKLTSPSLINRWWVKFIRQPKSNHLFSRLLAVLLPPKKNLTSSRNTFQSIPISMFYCKLSRVAPASKATLLYGIQKLRCPAVITYFTSAQTRHKRDHTPSNQTMSARRQNFRNQRQTSRIDWRRSSGRIHRMCPLNAERARRCTRELNAQKERLCEICNHVSREEWNRRKTNSPNQSRALNSTQILKPQNNRNVIRLDLIIWPCTAWY